MQLIQSHSPVHCNSTMSHTVRNRYSNLYYIKLISNRCYRVMNPIMKCFIQIINLCGSGQEGGSWDHLHRADQQTNVHRRAILGLMFFLLTLPKSLCGYFNASVCLVEAHASCQSAQCALQKSWLISVRAGFTFRNADDKVGLYRFPLGVSHL